MNDDEHIAAFIQSHGVTRCPAAAVAPTTAILTVPVPNRQDETDRKIIESMSRASRRGWLRRRSRVAALAKRAQVAAP